MNDVVAHPRHQLHGVVAQHVYLFYLVSPQVARCERIDQMCDIVLRIPPADVARGDDQIACVVRVGHDEVVVVQIVVLSVDSLDPYGRHALGDSYVHMPVLGLVALCGLYKRTGFQPLFYHSGVYVLQWFAQRVQAHLLQPGLYLLGVYEAVGGLVLDIDAHLGAQSGTLIGFVERGEGEYDVGTQDDVGRNQGYFFPVGTIHLLSMIFAICGT